MQPTQKTKKLSDIFKHFNWDEAGYRKGFASMSTQRQDAFLSIADTMYNPHMLPQLSTHKHTINNDGSNRRRRSERRQAHALVFCAVFLRYDFESERIGVPLDNGAFQYAPMIKLARISGLTIKDNGNEEDAQDPESAEHEHIEGVPLRFARAWRDLVECGIIHQTEQYQEILVDSKKYAGMKTLEKRAVTSIKRMSSSIFIQLGGIDKHQIKVLATYAKVIRLKRKNITKVQIRKAAAKRARRTKQCKPRMSARIRAIFDNLFTHYLSYYRQLKKVYPDNGRDWYREQIAQAFPL